MAMEISEGLPVFHTEEGGGTEIPPSPRKNDVMSWFFIQNLI